MSKLESKLTELMSIKTKLNEYKKLEKQFNDEVKLLLDEEGITKQSFEEIGIKVNYYESTRSTLNEEVLLEILNKLIEDCSDTYVKELLEETIYMKPTVNADVVEDLIRQGYIDINDISPAYEEKTVKTLKLNKF